MTNHPRPRGRNFFFAPGPTNIPDRILGAMHRATIDFFDPAFLAVQTRATEGVRRILKTKQHVLFYAANGHGAWEAGLVNCLRRGDTVLVLESGHFSNNWSEMARDLGLNTETLHADWRRGVDLSRLKSASRMTKPTPSKASSSCTTKPQPASRIPLATSARP